MLPSVVARKAAGRTVGPVVWALEEGEGVMVMGRILLTTVLS